MAFRFVVRSGLAQSMTASPAHHADYCPLASAPDSVVEEVPYVSPQDTLGFTVPYTEPRPRSIRAGPEFG